MRIGLLRHGRTGWNRLGLLQGRTDRPLDEGEPERLATLSLPTPWDRVPVLASPLNRARATAEILSGHPPPTDPRLTEMSFGAWEGQAGKDLRADPSTGFRDVEHWGWDFRAPDGETPREVWTRVAEALDALSGDTLIVCHMIVMRVVLAKAHGWDFEGPAPFQIKRDRIYGVTLTGGAMIADTDPVRLVPRCA